MNEERLVRVLAAIDEANAMDPRIELRDGSEHPREWLYGRRMSVWLQKLNPDAGEALQIAARGQHIQRWESPRERYPATREGYLKWRTQLYGFHSERVAELMGEAGYDEDLILQVKTMLQKRGIKSNPAVQAIEDVACLVFLEFYFRDFAMTQAPEKLVSIVRKTWGKMSEQAQQAALGLNFPEEVQPLLAKALSPE